jgi:hypothetical protein
LEKAMTGPEHPTYDLVIRGGTVIDPAAGLRGERDVAIVDGTIATVEPAIPAERAAESIDASGKLVLPGLIDLHTHLFWGMHGADPEQACLARGTTTALDAGSTGANGFRAFKEFIVARSRVRIQAWLNISTIGLIDTRVGELLNLIYLDVDEAVSMAEAHRDTIVGIKVASPTTSPAPTSSPPSSWPARRPMPRSSRSWSTLATPANRCRWRWASSGPATSSPTRSPVATRGCSIRGATSWRPSGRHARPASTSTVPTAATTSGSIPSAGWPSRSS